MEMSDLRWILLGVAIVIVAGVYVFSRARKKSQSASLLEAADDMPSFTAQDDVADNEWMDGVGPVRVVSGAEKIPQVKFIEPEDEVADISRSTVVDEVVAEKKTVVSTAQVDSAIDNTETPQLKAGNNAAVSKEVESEVVEVKEESTSKEKEPKAIIDDVISVYVLAKVEEKIKGEKILSASYALHLDYGEMKIFHRHDQTTQRKIEFSMANVQAPGWFEIDSMNDMETTGVSFFMQVNLVENPSAVLDEMLICAHNLSTMLGAMLCNGQRKILDEAGTIELREKVKRLEEVKAQAV